MDQRDLDLVQAAHRAAEHMPEGKVEGVSAWEGFVRALEAELAAEGYRIERFRGPARGDDLGGYRRTATPSPWTIRCSWSAQASRASRCSLS